ncbi:MAG TPA: D-glycero-beta-D-manno-heptose-7-phosphate kinase [Vicinamibacteria bacterium]|nr:D-glycero-beta-D-manno-heptose-7-phosphate kinase [Vicinamibacteria bacterium]
MSLSARRARALLRAMRGRRVLVAGDVMLDQFLWGRVARISPEAPVPVVEITSETFHLGGAANVAGNVRALGGEAVVAGVVGDDAAGTRVRAALGEAGIQDALAVAGGSRPTTVKTRIIAHHQQVVRADREASDDVAGEAAGALLDRIREALPSCEAVIVSDYHKGVITPALMKAVLGLARRRGVPVLVDPKVGHFALYRGVALVTPNQGEAEQATGVHIRGDDDLGEAGRRILRRLRCRAALITRGEHGMSLFEQDRRAVHIATAAREIFDVTGAGDTVIATVGLAACAGASLPEAARLANLAAGVVVAKLGTATATPDEVLAAAEVAAG